VDSRQTSLPKRLNREHLWHEKMGAVKMIVRLDTMAKFSLRSPRDEHALQRRNAMSSGWRVNSIAGTPGARDVSHQQG
jgi:hypothetical protein